MFILIVVNGYNYRRFPLCHTLLEPQSWLPMYGAHLAGSLRLKGFYNSGNASIVTICLLQRSSLHVSTLSNRKPLCFHQAAMPFGQLGMANPVSIDKPDWCLAIKDAGVSGRGLDGSGHSYLHSSAEAPSGLWCPLSGRPGYTPGKTHSNSSCGLDIHTCLWHRT